jgi:hypothetical protein
VSWEEEVETRVVVEGEVDIVGGVYGEWRGWFRGGGVRLVMHGLSFEGQLYVNVVPRFNGKSK